MTENNAAQPGLTHDERNAVYEAWLAAQDGEFRNYSALMEAIESALLSKLRAEGGEAGDGRAAESHFEDELESAYWEMDARIKGLGKHKGRPQPDRDAFKWAVRGMRQMPPKTAPERICICCDVPRNNCDCEPESAALASAPVSDAISVKASNTDTRDVDVEVHAFGSIFYDHGPNLAEALGRLAQRVSRWRNLPAPSLASAPVAGEAVAVLRREIGESSWFDHRPVRPGSEDHAAIQKSAEWDYCPVYAAPQASEAVRLDAPAQVGGVRFGKGIHWSTVISAAQRHHAFMNTPEKEAERIARAKEFVESIQADKDGGDCAKGADQPDIETLRRVGAAHDAVQVCPECNIAGCKHIRAALAAQRPRTDGGGRG
ncbi:hypothetical protein [Achromobacter spanius]